MPVNQTKLEAPQKGFTKKDFEDGKCTKDGFPIGKGDQSVLPPIPETPETAGPSTIADLPPVTTAPTPDPVADVPTGDGEAASEEKVDGSNPDAGQGSDTPK